MKTTLQQANNLISLKRQASNFIHLTEHNTIKVYEPFTGLYVKLVRANAKSRWYVYGSGKKQLTVAKLFGNNSSIIYVS